jgi:translation initiation factor eIF-2B subunit gamma
VITCYALLAPPSAYIQRVNTVASYVAANFQVATMPLSENTPWPPLPSTDASVLKSPKAQVGGVFVCGEGSRVGESSLKRCIVGKHCKIGDRCRLQACVLMDHVHVEDGCVLDGCVIGSESVVQRKSTLKDCRVGTTFVIPKESDFKNETLCKERD